MPISTQCLQCKHYLAAQVCDAFPDGIPIEIFTGEVDHRQPYKGDHGIQFELDENFKEVEDASREAEQ